jgi:hypothetical protein
MSAEKYNKLLKFRIQSGVKDLTLLQRMEVWDLMERLKNKKD